MGEKCSFLATCNLLNKFLKQKGSLTDLIAARASESKESSRPPITKSLLDLEVCEEDGSKTKMNSQRETTTEPMDLFPGFPILNDTQVGEKRVQKKAQLTIFYSGKVLVFDDFPEDKAEDLIEIAGKTISLVKDFVLAPPSTSTTNTTIPVAANRPSTVGRDKQDATIEQQQKPPQANTSNMRVARRASLHKFLEKRKDRISAKAPYQLNESQAAEVKKFDEDQCWLSSGEPSKPSSSNEGMNIDQE